MFIKLNFLSIATLVLVSIPSFSQSKYRNGAFLELGGNAVAYSLNYERQFSKGFMGRIGMTYYLGNSLAFPLTIGKVFGTGKHHFEAQLGIVLANGKTTYFDVNGVKIREERYNYILATGFIGYRYQKPDKRFFLDWDLLHLSRMYTRMTLVETGLEVLFRGVVLV